jgi:hypothetical protein
MRPGINFPPDLPIKVNQVKSLAFIQNAAKISLRAPSFESEIKMPPILTKETLIINPPEVSHKMPWKVPPLYNASAVTPEKRTAGGKLF